MQQEQGQELIDPETGEDLTEERSIVRATVGHGEVDIQVSTAKRYPRSITQFKQRALKMATLDEETAASCFYALPRQGKTIEGPSARLAEIVASAWGNIRAEARVVDEDDRFVYSEAVAWDLETNVAIKYSTRRRITNKNGQKFNDDMIAVTANAASSIALRNAVFKIVPMAYVRDIYDQAKKVAIGDAKSLADKRAVMIQYFGKMGVTPERVANAISKPSVEDIGLEDLAVLKGLATAIKEGDTTVDQAFPAIIAGASGQSRTEKLAASLADKKPDAATKMKAAAQIEALRKANDQNEPPIGPEEAERIRQREASENPPMSAPE